MLRAFIAATILAAAVPAQAHHSLTAYDGAREVQLDAVVAEFHYTHPHPYINVRVGSGATAKTWRLEMDNLFELDAIGVDRTTFKPGERVQVRGAPARDGGPAMYLRRLDRPQDGLRYEQVGMSPSLTRSR